MFPERETAILEETWLLEKATTQNSRARFGNSFLTALSNFGQSSHEGMRQRHGQMYAPPLVNCTCG